MGNFFSGIEKLILNGFSGLFCVTLLVSCSSTKKLIYFNNVQDTTLKSAEINMEPVIQVNDILSIIISSLDADASSIYNAPNEASTTVATSASNRLTIGYLVNVRGEIQFPRLGTIHVAGLTKSQLTAYITQQLTEKGLLKEPIATIRHLNYRVSVMGEVARPGVFSIPNERLSLLEALSLAGDITFYGKKDNVLLIRENDKGEKIIKRIDMTSQDLLSSPYYYLQSNDIVYVEPSKNRLTRESNTQILPIVLSALSLVIIAITSFR